MSNEQQGAIVPAQPQAKALVSIGQRGLQPSDMDQLWRAAQAFAKSGLAPKGIDTPEAVFVAMEMGLELGLPLMASLQNIAVVNGRPTLWGDSQLAVVRATGELEEFSEWYEQGGQRLPRNPSTFDDGTAAVCRVKRRGMEASETAFTVGDAKRASLWSKQGPWSQYPARMLRFRARSFALRDQFGDALRGLLSTEEAHDVVDVTPAVPKIAFRPVANAAEEYLPAEDSEVAEAPAKPRARYSAPTPAEPSAPEPTGQPTPESAPAQMTVNDELADIVTSVCTFDEFRVWAAQHFDGADTWGSFADVPAAVVARCQKNPTGMLNALRNAKGKK